MKKILPAFIVIIGLMLMTACSKEDLSSGRNSEAESKSNSEAEKSLIGSWIAEDSLMGDDALLYPTYMMFKEDNGLIYVDDICPKSDEDVDSFNYSCKSDVLTCNFPDSDDDSSYSYVEFTYKIEDDKLILTRDDEAIFDSSVDQVVYSRSSDEVLTSEEGYKFFWYNVLNSGFHEGFVNNIRVLYADSAMMDECYMEYDRGILDATWYEEDKDDYNDYFVEPTTLKCSYTSQTGDDFIPIIVTIHGEETDITDGEDLGNVRAFTHTLHFVDSGTFGMGVRHPRGYLYSFIFDKNTNKLIGMSRVYIEE